jgi:N-acetylmuramic acid 6-phosphate (MurNAc-6-P) etherase
MSDQSFDRESIRVKKERNRFLVCGALSIALAVGFGYSMASIRYQNLMVQVSATNQIELNKAHSMAQAAKDRIHRRYMRQINDLRKERAALDAEFKALILSRDDK